MNPTQNLFIRLGIILERGLTQSYEFETKAEFAFPDASRLKHSRDGSESKCCSHIPWHNNTSVHLHWKLSFPIEQLTEVSARHWYSEHPHKRTSGLRTSRLKFVILDTCYVRTLQEIYGDLFRLTLQKVHVGCYCKCGCLLYAWFLKGGPFFCHSASGKSFCGTFMHRAIHRLYCNNMWLQSGPSCWKSG